MHYRMKHCKPADNMRQSESVASKPLCDGARAFKPPTSGRKMSTDICSQASKNHVASIEDDHGPDMLCTRIVAPDADSRRRCRAVHMLYYLAAEPSNVDYTTIVEMADVLVISVIRAIAREYDEGLMGGLSPVESIALGRYRKSIDKLASYANSLERTREILLKPRKRRHAPMSIEYVPMLLTLASFKSGLSKYVDDFDESLEMDDTSEHSSTGTLLEEEEDLTDDGDQDDEAENDDEGEHEEEDNNDGSTEQSEQSDEAGEEASTDQSGHSDEASEDASTDQSEHSDETSEEISMDQSDHIEAGTEEVSTDQSEQGDEGCEEASTDQSGQSDEGSEEASTDQSNEGSGDESGEDDEGDDSDDGVEDGGEEESGDDEDEEVDEGDDDEMVDDEGVKHPVDKLKRPPVVLSDFRECIKRCRMSY